MNKTKRIMRWALERKLVLTLLVVLVLQLIQPVVVCADTVTTQSESVKHNDEQPTQETGTSATEESTPEGAENKEQETTVPPALTDNWLAYQQKIVGEEQPQRGEKEWRNFLTLNGYDWVEGELRSRTDSSYRDNLSSLVGVLDTMTSYADPFLRAETVFVDTSYGSSTIGWRQSNGNSELGWYAKRDSGGKLLWCIQPGVPLNWGANAGYAVVNNNQAAYIKSSLVAYWGWETQQSIVNAFYTERLIQEVVTGITTSGIYDYAGKASQAGYDAFKKNTMAKVNQFYVLPSFANQTVELIPGETKTLTDTNGSLSYYKMTTNSANVTVQQTGNTVKLTASPNSKDLGYIQFQYHIDPSYIGASLVYTAPWLQNVLRARAGDPKQTILNIKVKKNADVVVEHRDKYDNRLLQTKTESKAIGSTYSYTPTNPLTIGSETYVPTSLTPVTGVVQTGGNKVVLYYDLQRTLTVSHVDKITNQLIVDKEKVTKRRGEAYRFTPRTDLKKGNTPYRPLTTDPVTGTIGATNLEITFYYELPYATVGLERLEIDTAKADKGLPFRLQVTQEWLYDPTLLGDEELPVRVTLTDRDTKTVVYEQDYALQDLPKTIKGTIPTDFLVKEQRHNYEARIQVGNEEDILVTALQLDTDGYTSSEKELVVAAEEGQVQYKNVVRTARTYGKDMELYYETLNLDVPKLAPQKTGYGFSYTLKPTYTNDLGQTATVGFSLNAPESLLDSFLEYEKKEGKVSVPLEKEGRSYVLPNVWVEKTTGNLFSNAQVETHDPRIKQEVKNGGRKFYVPIWQDLGVYPVEVETTEPIGVHEISVLIEDRLSIEAYMFGTYASSTIQQDEIVLVPIDSKQPFHYQRPNNFTEADLAWFAESK